MGGMVANRIAMAAPGRVERLVTIGGVGRTLLNTAPSEGQRLLVEFTEDPTRDCLLRWLVAKDDHRLGQGHRWAGLFVTWLPPPSP